MKEEKEKTSKGKKTTTTTTRKTTTKKSKEERSNLAAISKSRQAEMLKLAKAANKSLGVSNKTKATTKTTKKVEEPKAEQELKDIAKEVEVPKVKVEAKPKAKKVEVSKTKKEPKHIIEKTKASKTKKETKRTSKKIKPSKSKSKKKNKSVGRRYNIKPTKKKFKVANKKLLFATLIILLIIIIGVIAYVARWLMDNHNTQNIIDELLEEYVDFDALERENPDDGQANSDSDYLEYSKTLLANVDFDSLSKKNKDTVAWIYVPGTNVNYPVVQGRDNAYYLTKSFNEKNNSAGWVFLDYRNNVSSLNQNSVVYAHARLDGTMFGTLRSLQNEGWFNTSDRNYITLLTKSETMIWQIYSVYITEATDNYTNISFYNESSFQEFLDATKDKSIHGFNVGLKSSDRILTLSTCAKEKRLVIHAKLIERAAR